ncbi:DUF981 family protein [Halovivax cerinus]|uniref:DUF981 family protein n=1 Tax=Halovivax cerinus TaxID=1487865 RepID=A0ABD5NTD9_9EURY|nr:DUF981 family protein [Halovivax cerinus]
MTTGIFYNTLIGLVASVALLLLVVFPRHGATASTDVRRAWAWTFGTLGGLLVVMNLHINFVWPLPGVANIVFGEPALLFGALLVAAAAIIYRTPVEDTDDSIEEASGDGGIRSLWEVGELPTELVVALRPVGYVGAFAGLMTILLGWGTAAFAEIVFRAPAAEWPTGIVAGTGIEVVYMTGTYTILGIGAILVPFGLHNPPRLRTAGKFLTVAALLLLFITLISFVGHISLTAGYQP